MTVDVGIMQGRLLPPFGGRFQAFPADSWRDEFTAAKEAGLACIEWIYEVPNEDRNPMADAAGRDAIRQAVAETGVAVRSICADYYMEDLLVRPDASVDETAAAHLSRLIGWAGEMDITYIVLPFVDASSLTGDQARLACLAGLLSGLAPAASERGVELHLETDLPPQAFRQLLDAVGHDAVKANYDIGNSASLGFDPAEELDALGPYLGSVHIKDRVLGGATVPLGTGNADFETCFAKFAQHGFSRWYILQAARGEDGQETALAKANRERVESMAEAAGQ